MQGIALEAEIRNERGKKVKRLRREGKIPGVFYLHGEENVALAVQERTLLPLTRGTETRIINLKLSDGRQLDCILRDIQFDPITDKPIHIDLQGIRADEMLSLEIPVVIVGGTAVGVRAGGIMQHIMHKLRVSCLPKDIPQHIEVNAESLAIGHSVHVRDIVLEHVTILDSPDSTVVAVIPPKVEKVAEAEVAVAEAPAEPEVIGKGKKEEGREQEEQEEK